jgi:hypothetical protein
MPELLAPVSPEFQITESLKNMLNIGPGGTGVSEPQFQGYGGDRSGYSGPPQGYVGENQGFAGPSQGYGGGPPFPPQGYGGDSGPPQGYGGGERNNGFSPQYVPPPPQYLPGNFRPTGPPSGYYDQEQQGQQLPPSQGFYASPYPEPQEGPPMPIMDGGGRPARGGYQGGRPIGGRVYYWLVYY